MGNNRGDNTTIIYKATNVINNKIYVGQTINSLKYRKLQHAREAKSSKRKNTYFHNSINKYGIGNYIFEEIDNSDDINEINEKERCWIKKYNSTNKKYGYNLDSGGRNGGKKSEETRKKIGNSTIKKWNNPETSKKMLNGLRKGTQTVIENAKKYFVEWICPICGIKLKLKPFEAKSKKYCSLKCASKGENQKIHLLNLANENHAKKVEQKKLIKNFIVDWCNNNKEIIINCPKNKITATLKPLMDELYFKYGMGDIRSYFMCFDVKNKKEFLDKLRSCIDK